MILADKIIKLRKENEWSQEEFALKMNVSRQAVSKWESAQTTPDLQKILQMANLFGVSTDYLLKDEVEVADVVENESLSGARKLSLEEVNEFYEINNATAKDIAYGVFLCILSCIPLLLLLGLADQRKISGNLATVLGVTILLLLVAMAVTVFVVASHKRSEMEFLDTEEFEAEYGVAGYIKEKAKAYKNTYTKNLTLGIALCIISAIPIISINLLADTSGFSTMLMVSLTITLVGIGVFKMVKTSIINSFFDKVLQVKDYTVSKKEERRDKTVQNINTIIWTITPAIYLLVSFLSNRWDITWVIFPVVGILSGLIPTLVNMFRK